jgi:tRNA U34 5-methylaminomethyl-2-thiouridine-forming methyltransferase MnmC
MYPHQIVKTDDGSFTLYNSVLKEHYHSTFGAIQESGHVFIQSGLEAISLTDQPLVLLEVGFGTGLNALLSLIWAERNKQHINYLGVEAFPITLELAGQLNYPDILGIDAGVFMKMHVPGKTGVILSDYFKLEVHANYFADEILHPDHFDLVFFDAFSPDVQPELWSVGVFKKIAVSMKRGGILTTYSTKGTVKRALASAGFKIEKLPGPPGKREILRAVLSE